MELLTRDELVRLAPPERLALIVQLWDSLEDEQLPLTAAQQAGFALTVKKETPGSTNHYAIEPGCCGATGVVDRAPLMTSQSMSTSSPNRAGCEMRNTLP